MNPTLIDVNDISIRLWRDGALICDSPSVAHIDGTTILFGEQALAKSRTEPQGFYTLHWSSIDLIPFKQPTKTARHHADLVYRHLEHLRAEHGPFDDVIFIVPSELNHEKLSMLLGIGHSLELNVIGIVDSAVANVSSQAFDEPSVQYLELGLFRTTVSKISVDGQARFESVQSIERSGQDYLSTLGVKWVADCFLDQARFDPLQQADTEQIIFDHLDSWVETLGQSANINVELEHFGRRHSVSLSRKLLLDVLRPGMDLLIEVVDQNLPVILSHRFNGYPDALFAPLAKKTGPQRRASLDVFAAVENQLENIISPPDAIEFVRQLDIVPRLMDAPDLDASSSLERVDGA